MRSLSFPDSIRKTPLLLLISLCFLFLVGGIAVAYGPGLAMRAQMEAKNRAEESPKEAEEDQLSEVVQVEEDSHAI